MVIFVIFLLSFTTTTNWYMSLLNEKGRSSPNKSGNHSLSPRNSERGVREQGRDRDQDLGAKVEAEVRERAEATAIIDQKRMRFNTILFAKTSIKFANICSWRLRKKLPSEQRSSK